jgi:AraC-like DNA-binding protein
VATLCEALYDEPDDQRGPEQWGAVLGMSPRTLTRRFNDEVGMPLSQWRRRLRLIKAVEMLGGGCSVTQPRSISATAHPPPSFTPSAGKRA